MTEPAQKFKIAHGEVRRMRCVKEKLHDLTPKQKNELLKSPVEVIFSVSFLETGLKKAKRHVRFSQTSKSITLGLKSVGVKYLSDAIKLSYDQLDKLPNFGAAAMAVYLDVLMAFDLKMPEMPTVQFFTDEHREEALSLADKLGLK
jgi:hypothetical protein